MAKKCKHCGQTIVKIRYMTGLKWMHVIEGAAFPTEHAGTAWGFCKITMAEPEEVGNGD